MNAHRIVPEVAAMTTSARRRAMPKYARELVEAVLTQCRDRQSLECAETQAHQWHKAWLQMPAGADSPAEWNW